MSDGNSQTKKSFTPVQYFLDLIGRTFTLFLAWLAFNVVLVACVWLLVRLTNSDIDPRKVWLANQLTDNRMIDLQEVAPGIQTIRHIYRLDPDGDDFDEWVVLYRYDAATQDSGPYRPGPYGAAVYDVDQCRPPAIVTYELRPYDYDYVAENLNIWWSVGPEMKDVNADGKSELALHIGNNLSVFRWYDDTQGCTMPGPGQQGYEVLGTFRGSGGVRVGGNGRVIVLDRGFFDRSQIAVKRVYAPDGNGSYLRPGGGGLYDPVEVGLTFGVGQPLSVTQSYYPEKAVLAFYLNLGADNGEARSYLCSDVRGDYPIKEHQFGIALPRDEMARVLVKEVSYTPNVEAERMHQTTTVTVAVVGVRPNGQADEGHLRWVRVGVRGVPKQGALPYNCEWCLESFQVVP
jgi:hypothetical protein